MYDVPKEYRTAIRSPTRNDRMAGKLTLTDGSTIELTDSAVISGSVSVDNQCVSGQELAFGSVYMGQASLQLRTALSSAAFYDAALQIDYEIQLADGSWYTLPVGRYTVAEAERSAAVVSLTGYDNMLKLERKFSGSVILGDAYTMLTQIADTCGVELAQTEAEIKALSPNAEVLRQLDGTYNVSTWRDCAGAIAQFLAGFATIDRLGKLRISQFGETACVSLAESARTVAKISDFSCHYAALVIETDSETFTSDIEGESGLEMTISDMPLAESGTTEVRQGICDAVFDKLKMLDYTPATVTMPGDPALELGDRVALPTKDTTPETLATHLVWKFRGEMTLKGVGKNPYLAGATTKTDAQLRNLQKQADANKIIYYSFTNGSDIKVKDGGKEVNAINLTFVTTQDTSAMFLAQMLMTAEPNTETVELPVSGDNLDTGSASAALEQDAALTLTVRYYLDNILIDSFTPQQRLVRGAHALALFYPFPDLEGAANHRWSVRLLCEGGTAKIAKGQIRATITGQGMAVGDAWDGTLEFEELVGRSTRTPVARKVLAIKDTILVGTQKPVSDAATEIITKAPRKAPTRSIV